MFSSLFAPAMPEFSCSISVFIDSGMSEPGMPVLDFLSMPLKNARPSEPRTMAMRPTVHAAWLAITCASQKPMTSMSALHSMTTIGTTRANSENTDPRGDFSRRFARSIREPSFLVSHLSKIVSWKPGSLDT